jgi:thiol-disulfide isomerase/thioredoxin
MVSGKINDHNQQYLYLFHHDSYDSTLVKNGEFHFNPSYERTLPISFGTENSSATDRLIFLENNPILIELNKEGITRSNDFKYDWITVQQVSGSKTDEVFTNYLDFKKLDSQQEDRIVFSKLKEIFNGNYGNALYEQLLHDEIIDSLLTIDQLRELYQIIKSKDNTFDTILDSRIVGMLYPEKKIRVGDKIKNFYLSDPNGELISTEQFKGAMFLIDFWASWCKPCREEFPGLIEFYKRHNTSGFEILGVSIDKSKDDWIKAIRKDGLPWTNVITENGQKGEVPLIFNIIAIPTNFLINEEGIVMAKDVSLEELEILLNY